MKVNKILIGGTILLSFLVNVSVWNRYLFFIFILGTFFWPFIAYLLANQYETNNLKVRTLIYTIFFSFHILSVIVMLLISEVAIPEEYINGFHPQVIWIYVKEAGLFWVTILGIISMYLYNLFFLETSRSTSSIPNSIAIISFFTFFVFCFQMFFILLTNIGSV